MNVCVVEEKNGRSHCETTGKDCGGEVLAAKEVKREKKVRKDGRISR